MSAKMFAKQTLILLATLFFLALGAGAQTTTVSATVTDPNGFIYKNGNYSVTFQPNPSFPTAIYNINGVPINTGPFSGPLDVTGTFSQVLADNSLANPKGSSWTIQICSFAGTCFFLKTPVSGATLNLTTQLNAVALPIQGNSTLNVAFSPTATGVVITNAGGQSANPFTLYGYDGSILCGINPFGFFIGGCNGGTGTIGGNGTPGFLPEWISTTTLGNSLCQDTSSVLICSESISVGANAYMISKPNSASGTTQFLAVSWDASRNAITAIPGASVRGVAGPGAGTSGTVQIAVGGEYPWTCDNQTTINDWLILSTTVNGECHDAGAVEPTGVQNVAQVAAANGGAGTATLADIFTPDTINAPAGPPTVIRVNGAPLAGPTGNFNSVTPAATANNQNLAFAADSSTPITNISVEVPLATVSQLGLIQLSKDLCGTNLLPLVCGIQGNPVTVTSPAVNDIFCFNTVSTIINCKFGVPVRTYSIATDTILAADRTAWVIPTTSGTIATTLAQPGTAGFTQNFVFATLNHATGADTITSTSSTINGLGTLVVPPNWFAITTSDNSNYFAALMPTNLAFPSCIDTGGNHLNFTAAGIITCGNSGAGGGSVTLAVPTELLVNGAASALCSTCTITKATEQPANFWAGPISASFANIAQSKTSVCTGAGTTVCTIVFNNNVGLGDAIVVFQNSAVNGGTSISATDSLLNTYTSRTTFVGGGPNVVTACNSAAGADTVTVTLGSGIFDIELNAIEVSGAAASCFDQARETTAGTVSPYTITTSGSVAQASELIITDYANSLAGTTVTTWAAGAGNTKVSEVSCSGATCSTSVDNMIEVQNQTTSLAGAQTTTATQVGNPMVNPSANIVAIKLSTTGSGVPVFRPIVNSDLPLRAGFIANCNNNSVPAAATGVTTEFVFAFNCVIPASTLSVGSRIAINLYGVSTMNGVGDTVTFRVKACTIAGCGSGTVVNFGSTGAMTPGITTANEAWHLTNSIINFTLGSGGTFDSQGLAFLSTSASAALIGQLSNSSTVAVNTTVDEYIQISAQNSVASDSVTLRNAIITAQ